MSVPRNDHAFKPVNNHVCHYRDNGFVMAETRPPAGVGCLYCKYLRSGWLTEAYLISYDVLPYMCGTSMARNAFLVEMESLLRVNMLYNWLSRVYGEPTDFNVSTMDIQDVWFELLGPGFYPFGVDRPCRLKFYIQKEKAFWDEMKNKFVNATKRIKL